MVTETKTYLQNLIDTQEEMSRKSQGAYLVLVPTREDGTPVLLPQYIDGVLIVDSEWLKKCC